MKRLAIAAGVAAGTAALLAPAGLSSVACWIAGLSLLAAAYLFLGPPSPPTGGQA